MALDERSVMCIGPSRGSMAAPVSSIRTVSANAVSSQILTRRRSPGRSGAFEGSEACGCAALVNAIETAKAKSAPLMERFMVG